MTVHGLTAMAAMVAIAGTAASGVAQDEPSERKGKRSAKKENAPPPGEDRVFVVPFGDEKGPQKGRVFGGPMGGGEVKLVGRFDRDGDGRLNAKEREAAREALKKERPQRGFGPPGDMPFPPPGMKGEGPGEFRPPFPPEMDEDAKGKGGAKKDDVKGKDQPARKMIRFGPMSEKREPAKPGKKIAPADVKPVGGADLYDLETVRTFFLDFDSDGWEKELADFKGTDVELPATLTVDGKKYPNVGVHFRGMSSFGMVQEGYKRSLNVSLDFADSKQRLMGRKTINLLNAHEDPSFMGTVLYSAIARKYLPAPKANFARVVINGENWGVYVNVEQFDKDFVAANYKTTKGHRWKVRGSPMGRGGLEYLGDNPDEYQRLYELKSGDDPKAWPKLIKLCKELNEGPLDTLEERLKPMLDLDGALRFLAVENALVNCDGYWIRASDYSIVCDAKGVFHVIPHDMNEAFRAPMGPGMGGPPGMGGRGKGPPGKDEPRKGPPGKGGPEGGGPPPWVMAFGGAPPRDLDPLHGLDDARKPLRSRLLSVPSLRARYLEYVRQIAREDLAPGAFAATVAKCKALIERHVADDTKKLTTTEDFAWATGKTGAKPKGGGFGMPSMSLLEFAEKRRKYLLAYKPKPPAAEAKAAKGAE